MMHRTKVTIITVTKNAKQSIQKTIESVCGQSYKNVEYIIIDGGSSDGTFDILKKNKGRISTLIHEADRGIYDAMNRGIAEASGDIVFFLNSGDAFTNQQIIQRVVNIFKETSADIVYGDALIVDSNGHILYKKTITQWLSYYLYKNTITHQTVFARRSVFGKFGVFDETYRVLADLDWEIRLLLRNHVRAYYERTSVVYYVKGGLSDASDKKSVALRSLERRRIRNMYYPIWQKVLFQCAIGVEYAINEIKSDFTKRSNLHEG